MLVPFPMTKEGLSHMAHGPHATNYPSQSAAVTHLSPAGAVGATPHVPSNQASPHSDSSRPPAQLGHTQIQPMGGKAGTDSEWHSLLPPAPHFGWEKQIKTRQKHNSRAILKIQTVHCWAAQGLLSTQPWWQNACPWPRNTAPHWSPNCSKIRVDMMNCKPKKTLKFSMSLKILIETWNGL